MLKFMIGLLIGMVLVLAIAFYNTNHPAPQKQFIQIQGHLINYDNIADASMQDGKLYIWTSCLSGWRNGVKTQIRRFKLSQEEAIEYYNMIKARMSKY